MGTNTLTEAAAGSLTTNHLNDKRTALLHDVVPRNSSGVPENEAGSLGTVDYQWDDLRVKRILVDGVVLDPTPVEGRPYQLQSGAANSDGSPNFLSAAGLGNGLSADLAAASTNLTALINNSTITFSSDETYSGLTAAPSTNNTMLVNDADISGSFDELTRGEIGNVPISFDNVGSEITGRAGEIHAFLTANSEVVLARIENVSGSTCDIYPLLRGWAGTSRAAVANNDSWTLLQLNTLIAKNDGVTFVSNSEYPVTVDTSPALGSTGRVYFERSTRNQKYDDGSSVSSDYIVLGWAICDDTDCLYVHHFDFDLGWKGSNDSNFEIYDTTTLRVRRGSVIGVGNLLLEVFDDIDLDTTTDLDSGETLTASKELFIYATPGGNFVLSHVVPRPFDYFKGGRYHPLKYYRFVGSVDINSTSQAFYKSKISPSKEDISKECGIVQRYETDVVSGSYSSGTIKIERKGNAVTISSDGLSHSSSSVPSTASGFIPEWARPFTSTSIGTCYAFGNANIFQCYVQPDGTLGHSYRDYSGAGYARTTTGTFSMTYIVN